MDLKKIKKYAMPALAVFVAITIFDMVFHNIIMEKMYTQHANLFRPHNIICTHKYYFWMANLIYSFAFCYIYSKGHEKIDSISQGIRFGLWVTLLIWIPNTIVDYTVYAHPRSLEIAWLAGDTIQSILAGITAAYMFKRK